MPRRLALLLAAPALAAAIAISLAIAQPGDSGDPGATREANLGRSTETAEPLTGLELHERIQEAERTAEAGPGEHILIARDFINSGLDLSDVRRVESLADFFFEPRDLHRLFDAADAVVHGVIVEQRVQLDDDASPRIVFTVAVAESLKGDDHTRVEVDSPGVLTLSRDDYVLEVASPFPLPVNGTEVIYFLADDADRGFTVLPNSSIEVRPDGTVAPLTHNSKLEPLEGRPADEVLQLLRDLTAGGP
jgi:hypothetical protein